MDNSRFLEHQSGDETAVLFMHSSSLDFECRKFNDHDLNFALVASDPAVLPERRVAGSGAHTYLFLHIVRDGRHI